MFWRSSKVGRNALLALGAIGLLAIWYVEGTLHTVKQRWFDEKLEAAKLAQRAMDEIKLSLGENRIVVDSISDPNATGLIGEQFTLITTDQGSLTSKLTATNPNWAAAIVDMLKEAGAREGDYVAISCTGSMPALNIAAIAAVEALGMKPVIVSSIGASMWGANNPQFTWLDMETILFNKGVFKHKSVAASIGGMGDRGGNLSPEGRELCRLAAKRNNIPIIEEETLDRAIHKRYMIFQENLPKGKRYGAYINIGGGLASIGSMHNISLLRSGLIEKLPQYNYPIRGTMILFGEKGIPIINLHDIANLAEQFGLPMTPYPLPKPPDGGVFFRKHYRTDLIAIIFILYSIMTFVAIRFDIQGYIKVRQKKKTDSR